MTNLRSETPSHDSAEITLKEFIFKVQELGIYLASKWRIILTFGIIGATAGFVYTLLEKPIYKAELSFAVQDEKTAGGLSNVLGVASQLGIDIGGTSAGGEFVGDNLLELMKSRSIIEKTLLTQVNVDGKAETLADFYIDFNKLRKDWDGKPELRNVHFLAGEERSKFTLQQDSLLGVFHKDLIKKNLAIGKADKKLSIITLTVSANNQLFAKYFAETLTKVVSDFYIQAKTEKSSKNVAVLQRQVDSVRTSLNSAISGVASSLDASPNPNPALQTLRVPSQRRQVDVTANSAILSELVKNLEISKMSLLQETPLIQIIDRPILPLEKQRTGKLKGIILGGLLGSFFCSLILIAVRAYRNVME